MNKLNSLKILPKIAICGPGLSGKDTVSRWLGEHTILKPGRSTSEIIAPIAAQQLGLTVEEAYFRRKDHRMLWFELGNKLRSNDPAFLVREALRDGQITTGLRVASEVEASRNQSIIDLFVWVDRAVPVDPTMQFGSELCDISLMNRGTLKELYMRLNALALFAQIKCSPSGLV